MRVFIAEKESQGKAIADALSENKIEKTWHILCGNDDIVTWASGHLYEQAEPHYYDIKYKDWKREDLPIIPERWEVIPVTKKEDQIECIHRLIEKATVIVNACDFDREGQLIGDEIIAKAPQIRADVRILRLIMRGLSKNEIRDALSQMKPNAEFAAMGIAALARARADWIVGMNMSRAYTLAGREAGYHKTEILSVGRVQTPTLGLVIKRDRAIDTFIPITHYITVALLEHSLGDIVAAWKPKEELEGIDSERRVLKKELAEAIATKIKDRSGRVSLYKKDESLESPPLPHSLTTLQIQANERNGLTAGQVLEAAQSLYERYKVISYPRSDTRYLPEAQHGDALSVLHAIARNDPEKSIVCDNADTEIRSQAWDDDKLQSHSHHGIIPLATTADLSKVTVPEGIVYDLICRAYIAQFYEDAKYNITQVEFNIANENFEARQRDLISPGWQVLYPSKNEKTKEKQKLPPLVLGDRVQCLEVEISEKKTNPPPRFTDASLIAAMNNVEKHIEDEEIRKKLLGKGGIGTEATRSDIIDTLVMRKFIERHGRQIRSTRLGRDLIDALPNEMTSAGLTAIYEKILEKIATSEFKMDIFLERQIEVIREMVATAEVKPRFAVGEGIAQDDEDDDGFVAHKKPKKGKVRQKTHAA